MTTLAELTTQIQNFCETREDSFVDSIPSFIAAAEERILNTVELPALRRTTTTSIIAAAQSVTLPTDFISAYSISVKPAGGVTTFLDCKDVSYLRAAYPDATVQGIPIAYALVSDTVANIAPAANATYTVEFNYFAKPESLVDNASGTWLSTNFGAALLYGALVNANIYIKGEQDIQQMYESQFQALMLPLTDVAKNKTRKDAYRSGQQRVEGPQ